MHKLHILGCDIKSWYIKKKKKDTFGAIGHLDLLFTICSATTEKGQGFQSHPSLWKFEKESDLATCSKIYPE